MIIATRLLLWAEAMAVCPGLILVRPERRQDEALLAHERVHQAQQVGLGTLRFWWRYLTDRSFRLQSELEAYRVQLSLQPSAMERIAQLLATRYFLTITPEQARSLLITPTR